MASSWQEKLKSAQKTCISQNGRLKVHYTFPEGTEMAEEYEKSSKLLTVRKWRQKGTLGNLEPWQYEVGESALPVKALEDMCLRENNSNPIFLRLDVKESFQWRIRNLPYPLETFSVNLNPEKTHVIIRTSNKKYYKKFSIPDMERFGLPLDEQSLKFSHINNTLIVSYKKPVEVLSHERQIQAELKKAKISEDNDVSTCQPS